jgi:hypothetical protein
VTSLGPAQAAKKVPELCRARTVRRCDTGSRRSPAPEGVQDYFVKLLGK